MTEFLIAVAVVIAVLVFTVRSAWQQITRLRKVRPEVVEHAGSAGRLRAAILELRKTWGEGF